MGHSDNTRKNIVSTDQFHHWHKRLKRATSMTLAKVGEGTMPMSGRRK